MYDCVCIIIYLSKSKQSRDTDPLFRAIGGQVSVGAEVIVANKNE